MGVEDVDVVEAQSAEALVEAGQKVFPRPVIAVWPGPHVVASLGGDDQFVAVGAQVRPKDPAEVRLGRAVGRAIVVGQVEVGDTAVERARDDRPLGRECPVVTEVLPESESDRR